MRGDLYISTFTIRIMRRKSIFLLLGIMRVGTKYFGKCHKLMSFVYYKDKHKS
jgi:hypothetical protein